MPSGRIALSNGSIYICVWLHFCECLNLSLIDQIVNYELCSLLLWVNVSFCIELQMFDFYLILSFLVHSVDGFLTRFKNLMLKQVFIWLVPSISQDYSTYGMFHQQQKISIEDILNRRLKEISDNHPTEGYSYEMPESRHWYFSSQQYHCPNNRKLMSAFIIFNVTQC